MKAGWFCALILVAACGNKSEEGTPSQDMQNDLAQADTLVAPDSIPGQDGPSEVDLGEPSDQVTSEISVVPWVPAQPVTAEVFVDKAVVGKVEGLAFDGLGLLYLTGSLGDVLEVSADGTANVVATVPKVDGFSTANLAGAAYSQEWGLLLVQYSGNQLHRYTPEGGLELVRSDLEKSPNGLLIGGDGRIYVSLSETGKVVRLDTPDGSQALVAEGLSFPNGMAWDSVRNRLYVASTMPKGEVYTLELSGPLPVEPKLFSSHSLLSAADGLAIAPDGHLLVAAFGGGKVVALDPEDGEQAFVLTESPAMALTGVASLAFGRGEGFSAYCLFATNMLVGGVVRVCPEL